MTGPPWLAGVAVLAWVTVLARAAWVTVLVAAWAGVEPGSMAAATVPTAAKAREILVMRTCRVLHYLSSIIYHRERRTA
jgi:hypothetical protein